MKSTNRFLKMLVMLTMSTSMFVVSCENEVEPEQANKGIPNNTSRTFTADELSDYLILKNSTKIIGLPPQPSGGNLQINSKDTIYLVKGMAFGSRVEVKHDESHEITGFYVAVSNSSFYFDVPIIEAESQETSDVFFLYLEDVDGMDFPFSFEVTILPHVNGLPIKKFVRVVTKEDPEDEKTCLPVGPIPNCLMQDSTGQSCNSSTYWTWIWESTLVEDNTGDIHTAYAPAMFINVSPFQHGGCCWNNISMPAKYDPYCVSGNPEYFELTVDDVYYVRYFEALHLFEDGKYLRQTRHATKNYVPDSSNYCTGQAGYRVDEDFSGEYGTHDFSPDANYINLAVTSHLDLLDPKSKAGAGWPLLSGELFYTCHYLVISYPFNGEKWSVVYQARSQYDPSDLDKFFPSYWD